MSPRLLAVLGGDVSRSLSPRMHNGAARVLDLPVVYIATSCATPEKFVRVIAALRELDALGANVTIPHKQLALEQADVVTETAEKIGAVNTLTFLEDGALEGDNTDGPALVEIFSRMPPERLESVQVLGAGGASRAAVYALEASGAKKIAVSARRHAPLPLAPVAGATLVVSTLPADDEIADAALSEWIDRDAEPFIFDVAYSMERASPLVARARALGLDAIDGLEMLVEQGARSLRRWTGGELSLIREAMGKSLALYTGSIDD